MRLPTTSDVDLAESTVTIVPTGLTVIMYPVTELPPSSAGAVHFTVALESPDEALTPVGMPGAVMLATGVAFEDLDSVLLPAEFLAITLNV